MNSRKILLAEDDSDDQKLFCEFLSHRTDIVLMPVAENGAEALEILDSTAEEELPDLIILDQNMPKSNGLQTLATLKANRRYAHLPVTIYSTYADESLVTNSMAAGAVLVIAKPLSRKGYDEMINTILSAIAS
jgi:CheY-like chemotaxis protein